MATSTTATTSAPPARSPRKTNGDGDDDDGLLVKPIPWLDATLTPAFLLEVLYSAWFLYTRPDAAGKTRLLEVAVGVVVVIGLIFAVKPIARAVFSVIRNKYSRAKKRPIKLKKKSQEKFGDQAWQLVVHVGMTLYSLYVMRADVDDGGSWWRETKNCWVGPGGELGQAPNTPLDRMYTMQLAIWIATAISHEYFDEKHKDYYVMYLHHIVTIFLVSFSWGINVKFGFLVLFVHDISDIGVDMIKLSNYLDYGLDDLGLPVTEVVFVSALVGWIYFRIYEFPFRLIRAAIYETDGGLMPDGTPYLGVCYARWDNCWTLRIALCVLEVMHIYWTYLLINILVKGFSKDASRQHYEGKSDTETDEEGEADNSSGVDKKDKAE